MMLAHRRKWNVAHQHHLVMVDVKGTAKVFSRIFVHTFEKLGPHFGHAARRVLQTFTIGVLADRDEELAYGGLGPRQINTQTCCGSISHKCWTIRPVRTVSTVVTDPTVLPAP